METVKEGTYKEPVEIKDTIETINTGCRHKVCRWHDKNVEGKVAEETLVKIKGRKPGLVEIIVYYQLKAL